MVSFEKLTLWPLVILIIILGVFPTPLVNFFNQAAERIINAL